MKKILIYILFLIVANQSSSAQNTFNDFGRIVINTFLPDNLALPSEAKKVLETKLNQITSSSGVGGDQLNPRFIITAIVNVGTKDIIAGPPQMVAQNLDMTMFIGDAITNTLFANITINLKGVGTNEIKAFIEALKSVNPKNKEILSFIEEGKKKIFSFYSTQCNFLLKDAQTLVKQGQYDAAIYQLSLVPDVCQDCYFRCLDTLATIYQQKIDVDGKTKLNLARAAWTAEQNSSGAEKAGDILMKINPLASIQSEVNLFMRKIEEQLKENENAQWQFKLKQYKDMIALQKDSLRIAQEASKRESELNEKQATRNYELDKLRVTAYREVATEYAKNQPKVVYRNINWK